MRKILTIDDSALTRSIISDIIDSDDRFQVADIAKDGVQALEFLEKNYYDAVVSDVVMPNMTGVEMLREIGRRGIRARVLMLSSETKDGAKVTLDCLELGAIDFVHKPGTTSLRSDEFKKIFLDKLQMVTESKIPVSGLKPVARVSPAAKPFAHSALGGQAKVVLPLNAPTPTKIVAIASSTGGPSALMNVVTALPAGLDAPVVIVQHMPAGFTGALAERLDNASKLHVKEANDGDVLYKGWVYLSRGGKHLNIRYAAGKYTVYYTDEPNREGVKPCANYMFESLVQSNFSQICAVVLTGMGADGTEGLKNLKKSARGNSLFVIGQDEKSSVVYGMPKAVAKAGLVDKVAELDRVGPEITTNIGVS